MVDYGNGVGKWTGGLCFVNWCTVVEWGVRLPEEESISGAKWVRVNSPRILDKKLNLNFVRIPHV